MIKSNMISKDGKNFHKFSQTSQIHRTSSMRLNNQPRSQISQILEVFELLKSVEIQKEKVYPNFIVTGDKGSGKTSFIEYITGLDLFPRSFYSKTVS
jgi:polynucleotide 5'-kinase involved in rRNA processing